MKALILKDFYNMKRIIRSYLLVLAIFSVTILPSSGPGVFMPMVTVYCAMMTISSFSFDEYCKWDRLALSMPLTRRQVIAAKFVFMLMIAVAGAAAATAISLIAAIVLEMGDLEMVILMIPISLALGMVMMGTVVPLVCEFGPEKGRILLLLAMLVPMSMVGLVWLLDVLLDITISESAGTVLLCAAPLAAGIWDWWMYLLSCRIYEKKEF